MTPFVPMRGLSNGHLQTIVENFLPRPALRLAADAETVVVDSVDGSRVLCQCHWQSDPVRAHRLTVVLVHGLEGSSDSLYVQGITARAWQAGWNVIRMNMRTCGGTETLTPTLYHSGLSGDVGAVVRHFTARYGLERVALVGYSMGGNLVLKLAGEWGLEQNQSKRTLDEGLKGGFFLRKKPLEGCAPGYSYSGFVMGAPLFAVATVCPAIDLAPGSDALHRPVNRGYERRFLHGLIARYQRKAKLYPGIYASRKEFGPVRSIREFDNKILARYSDFRDADDYYYRAAAARVVDHIAVPTLILRALDDPFIPLLAETRAQLRANPYITLVETRHGGHCAFLSRDPGEEIHWAEAMVVRFLQAQCAEADGS
jgi:hypothetical protein